MEERLVEDITTVGTLGAASSIVKTVSDGNDLELNEQNNWDIQLPPIILDRPNDKLTNHFQSSDCEQEKSTRDQNSNNNNYNNNNSTNSNILFFNYHEFQETYYIEVDSPEEGPKEHDMGRSIVITHFPNIYVSPESIEWKTTRIVRIPRSYDQRVTYPCFSEYLPGHESAAIIVGDRRDRFICQGKSLRDGQWYGYGSISPLSIYFTQDAFQEIVKKINGLIEQDFQLGGWINILDLTIGYFTFGLLDFSKIVNHRCRSHSTKVDQYIEELNKTEEFIRHGVQIIPLARSGYLSLDFQIPCPTPSLSTRRR